MVQHFDVRGVVQWARAHDPTRLLDANSGGPANVRSLWLPFRTLHLRYFQSVRGDVYIQRDRHSAFASLHRARFVPDVWKGRLEHNHSVCRSVDHRADTLNNVLTVGGYRCLHSLSGSRVWRRERHARL